MRRTLLFLSMFILLSFGCSTATKNDDGLVTLKIYHSNDVHAHLLPNSLGRGGFAYLASVLKIVKGQDTGALLLDGGDFYKKGSLPTRKTQDELTAQLLGKFPYDLRVMGNNEVKIGIPKFLEFAKKYEDSRIICANFVDKDGKTVFPPYREIRVNGLRLAVIGLTVPFDIEPGDQADPKTDKHAPYRITDPQKAVSPFFNELRSRNDLVLFLTHIGFSDDQNLSKVFPTADAIVGGHSHSLTEEFDLSDTHPVIVQSGEFGEQIGVLTLTFNRRLHKMVHAQSTFWSVGEEFQVPQEEMAHAVDESYKKFAPEALQPIANAEEELGLIDTAHPYESAYHDWVADVLKKHGKADVGLINLQALREPLRAGAINLDRVWLASPYEDNIAIMDLKTESARKLLESGIRKFWSASSLMAYGMSGAQVRLVIKGGGLKTVELKLPKKSRIKIAVPLYIPKHCQEIFGMDCPAGDVDRLPQTLQEAEIAEIKALDDHKLAPPELDRVRVIQ